MIGKKEKFSIEDRAEAAVREIAARMTPLEIGLSIYPTTRPVPLRSVPEAMVRDHLGR